MKPKDIGFILFDITMSGGFGLWVNSVGAAVWMFGIVILAYSFLEIFENQTRPKVKP